MTESSPIIIGLAGRAGTGKTILADKLSPMGQSGNNPSLSHLFFALPLHKIATARQQIKGTRSEDRMLYEIHECLFDVFGRSPLYGALPSYREFTELVEHIYSMPCEPSGYKARKFMQNVGDLCREYDRECFVKWVSRQIKKNYYDIELFLVSDIRFQNEANWIKSQPRNLLIKLVCADTIRQERLYERDRVHIGPHFSEDEVDKIKEDYVIDTTNLSVQHALTIARTIIENNFDFKFETNKDAINAYGE